jgi:amidohydrolase
MDIKKMINNEQLLVWRRHIHQHPEISFEEHESTRYIISQLEKYPEIEIQRPAETGVVATLKGGKPGKVLGLRADYDALPLQEETDLEFKSVNDGVMHACGHDCHAAMLLATVDALYKIKDELQGTVKFIFQHAEELQPGGAAAIVKSGLIDDVEAFYATHVGTDTPAGIVKAGHGAVSANTDSFTITITGKGCHGAYPQQGIDTLLVGVEVVQALNFIVPRMISSFDTAVLSVCAFNSGTADNIVPHTATMLGTVRTFKLSVQDTIERKIKEIAQGICESYGATCVVDYDRGYASIINDQKLCDYFIKICTKTLPEVKIINMEPMTGGEDFSAYGTIAPTYFSRVGCAPTTKEAFPHHHPKFEVDEASLPIGAALYVAFVLNQDDM